MKHLSKTELIKILSHKAEIIVTCIPEDTDVRGNALASGDAEEDKRVENEILRQLEFGNEWAWCTIKVSARLSGLEGTDYLGCCSYRNEQDFKNDAYFEDMKSRSLEELAESLVDLLAVLS